MEYPIDILNAMIGKRVVVIINEAQFPGTLIGYDKDTYAIHQENTTFLVNRRATDMIFLED